jgi:hypothetical protein
MSDVTNPGLVNVADQSFKPDLKVDSLAIPLDDDVLTSVAGEAGPAVINNPSSVTFPTPAEAIVGTQAPASPSQGFAEVPGVPPLYLPFPPSKADPNIQGQSVTAGTIAEITVGPGMSIQANLTPEVIKTYTITSVLDADTLQPVVVPTPPNFGTFSSVWGTGGVTTVVSPTDLTGLFSEGQAVSLTAQSGHPTAYDGVWTVSNLLNLNGTFDIAISGGAGKTILGSSSSLDGDLGYGKRITISGSPTAAYNGNHALGTTISVFGTITAIIAGANPLTTSTVVSLYGVALSTGMLIRISNTGGVPPAGYDGYWTVNNPINLNGSIQAIANGPPTKVTVTVFGSTAGLVDGQNVTISGTPAAIYDGQYLVSNVTPTGFDIVHAFVGDATGNWDAHTFDIITPFVAPIGSPGNWDSNTFTIDVPFVGWTPGVGNYAMHTFEIAAPFTVTSQGTWAYNPPQQAPTTRYRLYVTPANLTSFGISMLGRQIVFDDTAANPGASRNITGYVANWIVIDKPEPGNVDYPILDTDPIPGDTFTLTVQRQASEVITSGTGVVQDITLLPSPSPSPAVVPSSPVLPIPSGTQGTIDVAAAQPANPILTSGVQVPTAITVNIADQPPIGVGLPPNVFP